MNEEQRDFIKRQRADLSELIEKNREDFAEYNAVGVVIAGLLIPGSLVLSGRVIAAPAHAELLARECIFRAVDLLLTIYPEEATLQLVDAYVTTRMYEIRRERLAAGAAQQLGMAMDPASIHTPIGVLYPIPDDES